MVDELLAVLWHSIVSSSLAIFVVLAIRHPIRRLFGCGVAYGAWLAVPLCTAAAVAPAPVDTRWTLPAVVANFPIARTVHVSTSAHAPLWPSLMLIAWGIGFVVTIAWQVRLQRDFVRSLGPLVVDGDVAVSQSVFAGPSLIGLWRPLIAVPPDFEQRYTPDERELVLAHERAHARHGDIFVNAVCAALRCVWWFNPLVHYATGIVRIDQELTRDAEIVRAHPDRRHAYASAMLKAQLVPVDSPTACHWRSKHPLKERMMNLTRTKSIAIRGLGTVVVSLAMAGATYAAWAAQGASDVDPGRIANARWTDARPSTSIRIGAGPGPTQFTVSAVIEDLVTGAVLAKPKLVTFAGMPSTIEVGHGRNDKDLRVKLVVTIAPSGRAAEYRNEVVRDGKVESSQSGTLTVAKADLPTPAASTEAPLEAATTQAGPYSFDLSFSSSDATELACAADAFSVDGDHGLADAMRAPADGKIHTASFSTRTPTPTKANEELVASLSKCQLGIDSNLAWSRKPGRIAEP